MASTGLLIEPLGTTIRKRRFKLGLTLEEVSVKTGVSRPYLSLIETNRLDNPPADEKLRKLEKALGFADMELLAVAQYQRTPEIVRGVLNHLLTRGHPDHSGKGRPSKGAEVLRELLATIGGRTAATENFRSHAVPIINRTGEPYPADFFDTESPVRSAKEYVACPGLTDPHAFAARVHGSHLHPRFAEGDIVIFSPKTPVEHGDYGFVRMLDGVMLFGRVYREGNGNGQVRVTTLRDKSGEAVPMSRIAAMARAVYRLHPVQHDA